jgi:6-phosphogluconolactonase (cycloisomerase 2 family)
MKRWAWFLVPVMVVGFLAGGPDAEAKKKKKKTFFYILNSKNPSGEIFAFELSKTGTLAAVAGSPFSLDDGSSTAGGQSAGLAYSAARKVLFAVGEDGITSFKVAKSGALTKVVGSPFGGEKFLALAVFQRANQTYIYASSPFTGELFGFSVALDGSLAALPGFPIAVGSRPAGVSIGGDSLFLTDEVDEDIGAFRINANGSLTVGPNSPLNVPGTQAFNVNADPNAPAAYFADYGSSDVFGFRTLANGSLQALPGSPYAAGVGMDGGLALGTGTLLYGFGFVGGANPDVRAFRQNANGSLTALGVPQDLGMTQLDNLQFDPTEKFLGAVSGNTDDVRTFSVDAATGNLTQADALTLNLDLASAALFVRP